MIRLRNKRGFAIVMTVLLLGLLVVVVVSLATITRVETGIAGNTRRFSQARQNALMALNIAIGELQASAGPDQRVTARADIVDGDIENPHWTGVWNSDGAAFVRWLASGRREDLSPLDELDDADIELDVTESEELVGKNTVGTDTGNYVRAMLEDILAPIPDPTGDLLVGRYAWWIGDEGVKASVIETNRFDEVTYADTFDDFSEPGGVDNRKRIAQLSLPRQRVDSIFPDIDAGVSGTELQLRRVLSPHQISFVTGAPALADVRTQFHNFTVYSRGVLADVASGGLKYDLTNPAPDTDPDPMVDSHPLLNPGMRNFVASRLSVGDFPTVARHVFVHRPIGSLDPFEGYSPVVSEAVVAMGILLPDKTIGGPVGIEWSWEVELWNPYNFEIEIGSGMFLQVSIENHAEVSVDDGAAHIIDWRETITSPGADLVFHLHPSDAALTDPWQAQISSSVLGPGEIVSFTNNGSTTARDPSGGELLLSDSASGYTVALDPTPEPWGVNFQDTNGNYVSTFQPPTPIPDSLNFLNPNPALPACYSTLRFRLRDNSDSSDWLTIFDPRLRLLADSASASTSPFALDTDSLSKLSLLMPVPTSGDLLPGLSRKLFDGTRHHHVSVGALRNSVLDELSSAPYFPTFRIGESDEGPINGIFDSAFFSTLPQGTVTWGAGALDDPWGPEVDPLPNTRVTSHIQMGAPLLTKQNFIDLGSDPNDQLPAAHMLLRGAFNLNSMSETAWRALLRGVAVDSWDYFGGASESFVHAYFTLPQTAQNIGAVYESTVDSAEEGWRQGVRELSETEVSGIASELVGLKRARGGPFHSVAEFANSGLLESAILTEAVNDSSLDPYSPGFLKQADFLTAWAPFLQARSDTFLVRAYGESLNPLSGAVEGRAWCEAVVQRTPDYVDASDNPWEPPTGINDTLGRRFKIVQFRWLTPDDI